MNQDIHYQSFLNNKDSGFLHPGVQKCYNRAMKGFLLGVLVTVIVVGAGLWYRNAAEHASQPIVCPMDAELCPDGTSVSRTGLSCTFPVCPPPNVSLSDVGISFAIPVDFSATQMPDGASVAAYEMSEASSDSTSSPQATADIIIRQYAITASSTALATIQQTAVGGASGAPVSATSFSSTTLGTHRFTVVSIQRFEGVVDTAYYLARETDVLRFDAIDNGVTNWTESNLDTSTLPANAALQKLLTTLQGQ